MENVKMNREEKTNNLSEEDSKQIHEYYKHIDFAIKKLLEGYSHLVFIKGRGGIGKSHRIKELLTSCEEDFIEVTGDITEAYLYRLLYENNGKIIWFKDVTRLLRGLNSINILKAACETEKERLITKNSYSHQQQDLPDRFCWEGSLIFDYNEIGPLSLKEDFEALITRGDFVEVAISTTEMKEIMQIIAKEDWKKEVTNFLIENYESKGRLLNLRTQWKAFKTYEYAEATGKDWKQVLKQDLSKDKRTQVWSMLYTLIGNKAVRTTELTTLMLQNKVVNTARTAQRRIRTWIMMGELHKVSAEERNFYVSLKPLEQLMKERRN